MHDAAFALGFIAQVKQHDQVARSLAGLLCTAQHGYREGLVMSATASPINRVRPCLSDCAMGLGL